MNPRGARAKRLLAATQPAHKQGEAEDEQKVADDGTDQGGFDDLEVSSGDEEHGNDQLRQVAEGGVEQTSQLGADADRELVGRAPNEARQGNDRERRGDEGQQRLVRHFREQ